MGAAPDEDRGTCCGGWLFIPALAVGVDTKLFGPLLLGAEKSIASCKGLFPPAGTLKRIFC
jgi:hypothetical protein